MGVAVEYAEFGPVKRWRVSRTVLGRPLFYAALFWIDGVVIDAGPASAWAAVEPALARLPVKALVLTHHHEDHGGNAGRIAARFGCPVLAHARGLGLLADTGWRLGWYRHAVWGVPSPVKAAPIGEEVVTERFCLRVIETPGHAPDHVALYEPTEGLLFTGDLFLSEKLKMMRNDEDLPQEAASLDRLLALPSARLFCCHNPRVYHDHRAAVAAKLDHFRGLRARASAMRADGIDVTRISRELLGPEEFLSWVSRGRLSKRHLVEKLLAWEAQPTART